MVVTQRQLINKDWIMKSIEGEINDLLRIIERQDSIIINLSNNLKVSEKNRVELARGLCEELGILISSRKGTKKQQAKVIFSKSIIKYINNWANERNDRLCYNQENKRTEYGEGYKQACRDIFDKIINKSSHKQHCTNFKE